MKLTKFDVIEEEDVIIMIVWTGNYRFKLAFDTAVTHTIIDSNALFVSGYQLKDSVGKTEIETSNGMVIVELYNMQNFDCLGIKKQELQVQVYDFAAHGVNSEYHGMVGLNFLKDHKFCVDMIKGEITIN